MHIFSNLIISFICVHLTIAIAETPSDNLIGTNHRPVNYDKDDEDYTEDENLDDLSESDHVFVPGSGIVNSFRNLSYWAEKEELVFDLAKQRLHDLKKEVQMLEEYIADYESTTEPAVQDSIRPLKTRKDRADFIASSGIASYRMTYRFVETLQKLKERMAANYLDTDLHDILWKNPNSLSDVDVDVQYYSRLAGGFLPDWPNRIDLSSAMQALIHIQEVYNYDYNDLPFVLSPETRKPSQLNAFHSAQIGLHALYKKHYAVAVEWIEHAIQKVNNGLDSSISISLLEAYLELASETHNEVFTASLTSDSVSDENLFIRRVEPFKNIRRERLSTARIKRFGGRKESWHVSSNYNGICSGINFQTPKERAELYCWYDKTSSPARRILPYKKELLSLKPNVVQVYDFLGDKMIHKILSLTKDCLSVSHVTGSASYFELTRTRTSSSCWPPEKSLLELERKVEILTQADLSDRGSSEEFQVAEYTYGKIYAPHVDALNVSHLQPGPTKKVNLGRSGDRIISLLFYLNDVPAGGATPFCTAGTAALPVKGSVVIWKNVYRNGTAREDSWHGSCPVLYGHKQIASKIIRYNSQFRTYPCTLNHME